MSMVPLITWVPAKSWVSLPTHTRGGGHSTDGLFLTEKKNTQSFADTRKVTLKKY